jgi:hypothetical protein
LDNSQCHRSVTVCHICLIPQLSDLSFLWHYFTFCDKVSYCFCHCDTCHVCHSWDICDTRPKYHYHVSLDIKCVIVGLLLTHFNKVRIVGGEGCVCVCQKVIPRSSADSFSQERATILHINRMFYPVLRPIL